MTKDIIYLAEIPAGVPSAFLDDGVLYLDLFEDFTFQVTEKAGLITDLNKLQGSGVLDFTIPATLKNLWIFSEMISPNAVDRTYIPFDVRAIGGGSMALPQDSLFYKGSTETEIEVSLVDSGDFWLTLIQDMKLNEIDCGDFTFTVDNLENNWNEWIYLTGRTVWFPLVHYGRFWREQDQFAGAVLEDFLPWYSMRHLLTQGLRQSGWTLDSPLFDESWFNRLWVDVLATNLEYTGKAANYIAEVASNFDQSFEWNETSGILYRNLVFQNEVTDTSDSHQLTQISGQPGVISVFYNYTELESDYHVQVTATVFNNDAFPVKFDVVAIHVEQNIALDGVYNIGLDGNEEKEITLEFDFHLPHLNSFYLQIQGAASIGDPAQFDEGIIVFRSGSSIVVTPNSNRLYRGDVVTLNELINPDYTYLEFFKGVVHLMNLKFYTDYARRTVWLYPSEDTDLYGNIVEGFLRPPAEAVDLTEKIVQGSRKVVVQDSDRTRYYRLKFKKSEDPYITDRLGIVETDPLYGRFVDLGRGDITEPEDIENPFFEPTADTVWNSIKIPAVWDNTDGVRTRRHGARVVLAVGNYGQGLTDDPAAASSAFLTFEYIQRSIFPYASQLPTRAYRVAVPAGFGNTDQSVVYGGALPGNDDLYEQFWLHEIQIRQYSKMYEFLAVLDEALFTNLDFRDRLVINYLDDKGLYRLLEKADYRTSNQLPVILRLRPEPSKVKTKW